MNDVLVVIDYVPYISKCGMVRKGPAHHGKVKGGA